MATSLVVVDTGGAGDYSSLNAAEAADFGASADFVATSATIFCECQSTDGSSDTASVTIDGQTADETYNVTIFADDYKHRGVFPKGDVRSYRLEVAEGLELITQYTTLRGLAVQLVPTASVARAVMVSCTADSARAVIDSCILDIQSAGNTLIAAVADYHAAAALEIHAYNNVIYSRDEAGNVGIQAQSPAAVRHYYHNTVYNCGSGFYQGNGTSILKNNLGQFNQNDYFGSYTVACLNNGYTFGDHQPNSATNSVEINSDRGGIFYNASEWDLRAVLGSRAHLAGTDLLADPALPVTVDILGEPRGSAPTLGAFNATEALRPGIVIVPRPPRGSAGYMMIGRQAWV